MMRPMIRPTALVTAALGALSLTTAAQAAEVRLLATGAVATGLAKAIALYQAQSGHTVVVSSSTGPEVEQRIGGGEQGFDVVAAPEAVLAALNASGRLKATPVRLGKVGIAVAVMPGTPRPDLTNSDKFKAYLIAAKTVVISRGSTGAYLEEQFKTSGLTSAIGTRLERGRNGAAVVERLLAGSGAEVGLSAQSELAGGVDRGLIVVGLAPAPLQNYTTYAAAAFPQAQARPEVAGFMALLRTPASAAFMASAGLE